ncbi:MAG: Chemotaxis response regulator protein-glutamate methylesterase [Verrucomicrobiae bacterium]|nr:Chemotaxis response regulator protein-glutamate methylesterase [Verrucomicrobiae bacterium]
MNKDKINVLVVEDSPVVQMLMKHLLDSDPQLHVMGTANNGQEAVDFVAGQKPDVILMDVHMPKMDGYEATRRIMETQPVPIVISSATMTNQEVGATFHALEAGAVAFIEKPVGLGGANFDQMVQKLLQTVKLMAEVKVVKRWGRQPRVEPFRPVGKPSAAIRVIAIGASTGGPPVIQSILAGVPKDLPVPVLIVQHIAAGFLQGMVDWLKQTTGFPVHMAAHGKEALPGCAYLAPDGWQMGLGSNGRILLSNAPPENGLRPAVSYLLRSVAQTCGPNAVGVLLTGMGTDGAEELKLLKDQGAITIAQDAETAVVHGMPGAAIRLGAATYILPANRIAAALATLVSRK